MREQVVNHKGKRAPLARRENFVDHFWEQIILLASFGNKEFSCPLLRTHNFVDLFWNTSDKK